MTSARPGPSPPRAVERLLRRRLASAQAEVVLGDMVEDAAARGLRGAAARLYFWREALAVYRQHARAQRVHRRDAESRRRRRSGRGLLSGLAQDLRFALRTLRRRPGVTAAVVGGTALAIGANTAIFAVVDGILLRPLPYPQAARLVRLFQIEPAPSGALTSLSPPNYFDWLEQTRTLDGAAAYWSPRTTLTGHGEPEQLLGAVATHQLFPLMRVAAALGRVWGPDADQPGADPVVVLAHGLWQRRFGASPDALGTSIVLDGRPHTVIGVMPPGFSFPRPGTELWMPLRVARDADADEIGMPYRAYRILEVVARLDERSSVAAAAAEAEAIALRLARDHPDANAGFGATVVSLHDHEVGDARPGLLALQGAVLLLLVIACANLSSIMLARSAGRGRELAVRTALGASRFRLARQLLVESALLSALGGALGAGIAAGAVRALQASPPPGLPRVAAVALDVRVLAFAALATLLTGAAFGLGPALHAAGRDLYRSLRAGARDALPQHTRARATLVAAQVGVATVLLVAAGLLVRSLGEMLSTDPGFRAEGVPVVARLSPPRSWYRESQRPLRFYEELLERVTALPGLDAAALSIGVPLGPDARFFVDRTTIEVEGAPPLPPGQRPAAGLHVVSPGLLEVLGIPLIRGRFFDERDRADTPAVAVINEALARQLFGDGDPLGRRLRHDMSLPPGSPDRREIVGVVADVRHFELSSAAPPQLYVPHHQSPWPGMHLIARGSGDPAALASAVRGAVRALDPDVAVPPIEPLSAVAAGALSQPRFHTGLLAGFAAVAVAVACLGLYGMISYAVACRTREIGVRLALGARRSDVIRLVVSEGMTLALSGLAAGLLAAVLATRLLQSLLFEVAALDPATFSLSAALLAGVALLACWVPARGAARVNPLSAIRAE